MNYFQELPKVELDMPIKIVNMEKLELDINDFKNNDIIIINSGTATGKTRAIGKIAKELTEDGKYKILSIVNLISLSREQIKTFREESETILEDYQKGLDSFNECNGTICLNSLYKLKFLENYTYDDKIVYIDEINDMIKSLTHNDGLDNLVNIIYTVLTNLIKNCKKIILSDATIDNNIKNLLMSRKTHNKSLLIKNTVQKFKDINANEYLDENLFFDRIRKSIREDEYFLFGCDGCKKITGIYTTLLSEFEDKKDKFKLYTSEELEKVKNASIEFRGKFIFYSPSITTGVSFVFKDVKQPQYIYITNTPQIKPDSIYQMSCRTRNMKELNFYCNNIKPKENIHNNVKEVEKHYKKMIRYNNRLLGLSSSRNIDDEVEIIENTFFKLFCFEEYKNFIFKTGFLEHYKNYLTRDGFKLKTIGEVKKINKGDENIMKMNYELKKLDDIEDFSKLVFNIVEEEDYKKLINKYKTYYDRLNLLNISNEEELNTYKIYIEDDYKLKSYFSSIALFKTSDYILKKLNEKKSNGFDIKITNTVYNKIRLLETFEKHYKIERFNLDFKDVNTENEISKEFKSIYQSLYPRLKQKNFKTKEDILKIYVNILKDIANEVPIISSVARKTKDRTKSKREYKLNKSIITEIINLTKLKNETLKDCNIELIEKLTGIKPDKEQKRDYIDDDKCLNNYVFNKSYKQGVMENITDVNTRDKLYEKYKFSTLGDKN